MASKTKGNVNYGIFFDMSLVGGVKTAADLSKATKSIKTSINKAEGAVDMYKAKLHALNKEYAKGAISKRTYNQVATQIAAAEARRVTKLQKERAAVLGLDRQESILAANRKKRLMAGGSTARIAGMAAAGLSGLGMGGRAAGAARFLGGAAGMGAGAAAMAGGFLGIAAVKEAISVYADLESQIQGMKSLFGEDIAVSLNTQFRNLAKTTILTNRQLIENAKIWASYGLTTEGITDRLKRLGTVAGGNSEKFRLLTVAFAQVNAQGKLMGQEKNQLINAGMNLKSVADAAGISMENFAEAMKNGEIRAEHLNEALVNITSEGGMFADYLEKQAETINGKITILSASWEEFLVALGSTQKGPVMSVVEGMIVAAEALKQATDAWNRANGFTPGVPDPLVGQVGVVQAGDAVPSSLLRAAGRNAIVDLGGDKVEKAALEMGMSGVGSASGAYAEGFFTGPNAEKLQQQMFEADRAIAYDQAREREKSEKEAMRQEADKRKQRKQLYRMELDTFMMREEYEFRMQSLTNESIKKDAIELYKKRYGSAEAPDEDFVGPMPSKSMQDRLDRQFQEDEAKTRERQLKEEALLLAKIENEKQKFDKEMEFLDQQEKEAKEKFDKERRLAESPSPVSFKAASVEEFMFLRQMTQRNETAAAIREAQAKNDAVMREIDGNRKIAEQNREDQINDLILRISELETK